MSFVMAVDASCFALQSTGSPNFSGYCPLFIHDHWPWPLLTQQPVTTVAVYRPTLSSRFYPLHSVPKGATTLSLGTTAVENTNIVEYSALYHLNDIRLSTPLTPIEVSLTDVTLLKK